MPDNQTTTPLPPGVGRTALMTAYARAQESLRPDRLFADPWAAALVDAALAKADSGVAVLVPEGSASLRPMYAAYFASRTPFLDEQVLEGVAAGARQVVLLAAGLDARSGRLDLPSDIPVYEVDSAPVLNFKAETLARSGLDTPNRIPVIADLSADWTDALDAAGFRPELPTVWLAEGLFMYLDDQTCERLFTTVIGHSAPGSRVAIEYFQRDPRESDVLGWEPEEQRALMAVASMFRGGPSDTPKEWLARFAVHIERITDVASEISAQGRPVPPVLSENLAEPITIWLASATW